MKQIYDEDTANEVYKEESAYYKWVNQKKNAILNIANSAKKQIEWDKIFPKVEHSDDWLLEAKTF